MLELYIEEIQSGNLTIDQVPDLWREEVKLALEKAEQA